MVRRPDCVRFACEDLSPDRTFVVYGGFDRYIVRDGIEVISLTLMCSLLAAS